MDKKIEKNNIEDAEELPKKKLPHSVLQGIVFVSFSLGVFHLYTSFAGPLVDFQQRDVHLFVLLALSFLMYPFIKGKTKADAMDYVLALCTACIGMYLYFAYYLIVDSGGIINNVDLAIGFIVLILVLEATRRAIGWGLPILAILFLLYGIYKKLSFYPVLNTAILLQAFKSLIVHLVFITEGVFSTAIGVSASYIVLFIIFGAFLLKTGLGEFFHDISLAIGGGSDGGPAKVATIASGMFGSINGASVANVVTTGTFTIPLMKKVGYDKNFAGAVEASASVGGQILPPVMGAAAFIMAETLAISYIKIVLAGIIPALLYYLGILFQLHLRAKKLKLKGLSKESLPKALDVLKRKGYVLFPMLVLMFLLFTGKTVIFAASWSIISVILISATAKLLFVLVPLVLLIVLRSTNVGALLQGDMLLSSITIQLISIVLGSFVLNLLFASHRSLNAKAAVQAMCDGIRSTIPVALSCACVGIIVGVTTLTGVALNVAQFVITVGESIPIPFIQLLITLVLTMVSSILLGMGLPSIPTYIITSTMAAPILLGIDIFRDIAGPAEQGLFIAHMFVFYFGIFANITPPVALAAYAAAGISKGNPTTTGFYALKLSLAGFIVPFIFVFAPEILLIDPNISIIITIITAVVGVYLLSTAVEGYWSFIHGVNVPVILRFVLGFSVLLLVFPGLQSDGIGILLASVALFFLHGRRRVREG